MRPPKTIYGAKAADRPLKKILMVEDDPRFIEFFDQAFEISDMHVELHVAHCLDEAMGLLRAQKFDAMIIDCGFPERPTGYEGNIVHDNRPVRLGPILIHSICAGDGEYGDYGEHHQRMPIAFNSREHPEEKFAELYEGPKPPNVKIFKKGPILNDDFTRENVALPTIEWLSSKLYTPRGKRIGRTPREGFLGRLWPSSHAGWRGGGPGGA